MKVKIKEKYENISFINITDVYNYFILKIIDKSKYIILISEIKEPVFFNAEPVVENLVIINRRNTEILESIFNIPILI